MDSDPSYKLLFSKQLPNYKVPHYAKGRKIYACECGDEFIFESSYEYHINRKVLKIIFNCKLCKEKLVFQNRCNFLHHIITHNTKSIKINYNDLRVELLQVEDLLIHENEPKVQSIIPQVKANIHSNSQPTPNCRKMLSVADKIINLQSQNKTFNTVHLSNYLVIPENQPKVQSIIPQMKANIHSNSQPTPNCEKKTSVANKITNLHPQSKIFNPGQLSNNSACSQQHPKMGQKCKNAVARKVCKETNSETLCKNTLLIEPQIMESNSVHSALKPQCDKSESGAQSTLEQKKKKLETHFKCDICSEIIIDSRNTICTIRAHHYRRFSNKLFKCPVCLFILPNECAMETHLKLHLHVLPYICPDCGKDIKNNPSVLKYPYSHECEGFRMMRLSARIRCPLISCKPFHPNDFINHMKENHLKIYFKCVECNAASPDKNIIYRHLNQMHSKKTDATILFQCLMCKELLPNESVKGHILTHATHTYVYPCWNCHKVFYKILSLINHSKICQSNNCVSMLNLTEKYNVKSYKVHKRCDKCNKIHIYKCRYSEIDTLPNVCPDCASLENINTEIHCPICKETVGCERKVIEKHFASKHKEVNINARVTLKPCDYSITRKKRKIIRKNINNIEPKRRKSNTNRDPQDNNSTLSIKCGRCNYTCANISDFEQHLLLKHRDPCAAYQCLECGQCFIVKGSFSTHLAVDHNISDVDTYISNKNCFNQEAFKKQQGINLPPTILHKNQCEICLERFDCKENMDKHFRVHGMAYLLKKCSENTLGKGNLSVKIL